MQEHPNPLKAAVTAGRPHLGLWCSLASALTTEVVAGSRASWLLIDGEHSPNDLRTIMAQLQVLGGFACEGVVRLPSVRRRTELALWTRAARSCAEAHLW